MTRTVGHTLGPAANDKVFDRQSRLQFSTVLNMSWKYSSCLNAFQFYSVNIGIMFQLKMGFFPRMTLI